MLDDSTMAQLSEPYTFKPEAQKAPAPSTVPTNADAPVVGRTNDGTPIRDPWASTRTYRTRSSAGIVPPKGVRKGESGFIVAPGRSPVKTFAGTRAIPKMTGAGKFAKAVGGDAVGELVIGAGLSYLTGESNNPVEAAVSAAGSAILSDNTGGADIKVINGTTYHYDSGSNRLRDVDTGEEMGLAIKGGQEVAVPYGGVAGKKGTGQILKETVQQTATAIKDTAVTRRQQEVETTGMTSGRGAGRTTFAAPKPARSKARQLVKAKLNGKEGIMIKGDPSSWRMSNW